MEANNDGPRVFIEGIDVIINRDLEKHRELLEQARIAKQGFTEATAYQVSRKRHYVQLLKDPDSKYNRKSMEAAIENMNVDIRHMQDQAKIAEDAIQHHQLIVTTLQKQLDDYYQSIKELGEIRKKELDAASSRLGKQGDPGHISNN